MNGQEDTANAESRRIQSSQEINLAQVRALFDELDRQIPTLTEDAFKAKVESFFKAADSRLLEVVVGIMTDIENAAKAVLPEDHVNFLEV